MNRRGGDPEILESALVALKRTTGLSATIASNSERALADIPDAQVTIQTNQGEKQFAVCIKAVDRFQTPAQVKAQARSYTESPLLIAPFISSQMASYCRDLHLSFVDTAGNAYLEAPGLFVYVTGQPDPKRSTKSNFRSLSSAGLQVSFALLSRPALLQATYREIAQAANVALGTVTHAMRDLRDRGLLIERQPRVLPDPLRVLEEWVTHYPITLRPKLNPKRFSTGREQFAAFDLISRVGYWGGEPAAQLLTNYMRPARHTIYTHASIKPLIAELRLRADPKGTVEILQTFWNFEADPKCPTVVPPVLVYADLLATHDGRNAEVAKLIFEQHIQPIFSTSRSTG